MPPLGPPHPEFGRRVRQRREALNLRQADIADHVDVSVTSVRSWEHGRTGIDPENMPLLVEILECLPTDLWPDWKPRPKRGGSSSSNLREMRAQIDELRNVVERGFRLIAERPRDLAALRQVAEAIAEQGADSAQNPEHEPPHKQ